MAKIIQQPQQRESLAMLSRPTVVQRQLEILALRSLELADQVAEGQKGFLEAVDLAYDAAVWVGLPNAIDKSGLIDNSITGDDIVQATLAAAFANTRRP
jgi:hypothetical protein